MMNKELYTEIFRRKSFHTFRERINVPISEEELEDIYVAFKSFDCLNDVKIDIKIEKDNHGNIIRNSEYVIKIFSEIKDGYLQNVGYVGEQLDLYLVSKNIGSLWYGIAKSDEVFNGLNYVIMIAIAKVSSFRKDMYKAKRKELDDIWDGDDLGVGNICRFSPSACNSQPWFVSNEDNKLSVYRKSKSGKVGIMPKGASVFYNQIDIGIFMCILELCLLNKNIKFNRKLVNDDGVYEISVLNAVYEYEC